LVGRDGVKAEDIRIFRQATLNGDVSLPPPDSKNGVNCRGFEFESLDLIELAPWLILQLAQDKARAMIEEAVAQVDEIRAAATRDGAAAGREEAMKETLPSLIALADAGQSLIVFEEQLIARCTPQIVALALEIAEKVIGKAVQADAEIVARVLERAKQETLDAKRIRVWLHPDDHRVLAEMRPDLVKIGNDGGRTIEIAAAENVARGGCRIETESGLVDATIPTQLDEIRRQLLDAEL
jgi:flagellar assembly protein FliH